MGEFQEQPKSPFRHAVKALGLCLMEALLLLSTRHVHQPKRHIGRRLRFADGTTGVVYRETVVERAPTSCPAVLVVEFQLQRVHSSWAHALFRLESLLNTVLFVGFPGFVSKLWLRHDEHHVYRGFYEWDGPDLAAAYVGSLWWPLALVSIPASIHYVIVAGAQRDEVLRKPSAIAPKGSTVPDEWWRLVEVDPPVA
jgi:hypothetical protein